MIKTTLKYNDAMQILNFANAGFSVFIYNEASVEILEYYAVTMPVQIVFLTYFVVLIYFLNETIVFKSRYYGLMGGLFIYMARSLPGFIANDAGYFSLASKFLLMYENSIVAIGIIFAIGWSSNYSTLKGFHFG